MAKSIAKKDDNEMVFSNEAPEYVNLDSGRGQENVGLEDITIPRLDVLQDLSPQRKKNDPAYIEGAEEGMLFNTVTGELYGTEVYFIPCYYKKEWLIWKLQGAGGGFNGAFNTEDEAKAEFASQGFYEEMYEDKGQKICAYEIVDTANHFGLVFDKADNVKEICVSMSKSKMKVNRSFNTLVKLAGGDRFSRVYKVSAVEDTNKANQSYYNMKITSMGYAPESMFLLGEKMYESMSANEKQANYNTTTETTTEGKSEEF